MVRKSAPTRAAAAIHLAKRIPILLLILLAGWHAGAAWADEATGGPPGQGLKMAPVGGEIQVNTFTTGPQWAPALAMDADGDFVVVWTSYGLTPGKRSTSPTLSRRS